MLPYMELLAGTDACLSGRAPQELLRYEITDLRTGACLKVSGHGWLRLVQCAQWGDQNRIGPYAIGLKSLWGPRDGRPLWIDSSD